MSLVDQFAASLVRVMRDRQVYALNSALAADQHTVTKIVETRFPCNTAIEGPDVFAVPSAATGDHDAGVLELGGLGLINGMMVACGMERIQAVYDDAGLIVRFQ